MYKSIQGCRALAAIMVVLFHLGTALGSAKYFGVTVIKSLFIAGDSGVEFFFVLSGFIITWVHFGDIGKPRVLLTYLRKRANRIYPSYWIIFGLVYLLAQVSPTLRSTVPHDYATVLKSLALLPQEGSASGQTLAPVLAVAWSLQYEICFYALMGLFIANRFLGLLASVVTLANFGACHVEACSFPRNFFASNLILLFALGVAIAIVSRRAFRIGRSVTLAWFAALLIFAYGAFEAIAGTNALVVDRSLVYGVLSGVLIFALVQAEDGGRIRLSNRWIPLLGDASYALYLVHYPLISVLCKLMIFLGFAGALGAVVAFPVIFGMCIAAAVAFHLFVEKPLARALARRKTSVSVACKEIAIKKGV